MKKNKYESSYSLDTIFEGLCILLIIIRDYEEAKSLMFEYHEQYKTNTKEIMYYILTRLFLNHAHQPGKEILSILNLAASQKIELRENLQKLHKILLKNPEKDLTYFYL